MIHKQSALGENSKIVSHTQNLIRRMKCTRELLPMESRIVFIDEFCWQLISSRLERDCLRCKEAVENGEPGAKEAIYPGESARSGAERAKNHYDDYNNNLEASHMMKHFTNSHSLLYTDIYTRLA